MDPNDGVSQTDYPLRVQSSTFRHPNSFFSYREKFMISHHIHFVAYWSLAHFVWTSGMYLEYFINIDSSHLDLRLLPVYY